MKIPKGLFSKSPFGSGFGGDTPDYNRKGGIYLTGKDIFERALDLCALRGAGDSLPDDVGDLQARAVGLLNTLAGELHALDERLCRKECRMVFLHGLEETVDMHNGICSAVLPYKLAALFVAEEDKELYTVLQTHAAEAAKKLLADGASRRHSIVEVYG